MFIGFGLAAQRADENVAAVAGTIREEAVKRGLRTNVCAEPLPDKFDGPCETLSNNVDARDLDRTLATIGLIAVGVGVATTVTAYFLSPGKPAARRSGTQIAPIAGTHQTGLAVIGTF